MNFTDDRELRLWVLDYLKDATLPREKFWAEVESLMSFVQTGQIKSQEPKKLEEK